MAHREQRDTPVGDSVLAIVGAFTNGLDVCKRLRERRRRRKSTKKPHRATPAQLEPSGDELQLSNSLRQNPVDIQRHYETNYAAVGEKFAQGDAIAHASLTEVLLKLNSGLVAIIGAFLTPGKSDHHPDYKSLTSLSDTSRAEAVDALGQLYQRLSQSQLVLDRVRHKCPSCGSHHHPDCASSTNLRQRGGCGNAKRIPGAKPKHRRSQTELVMLLYSPVLKITATKQQRLLWLICFDPRQLVLPHGPSPKASASSFAINLYLQRLGPTDLDRCVILPISPSSRLSSNITSPLLSPSLNVTLTSQLPWPSLNAMPTYHQLRSLSRNQQQQQQQPQPRTSTSSNRSSSPSAVNLHLLHPSAQLSRHGMLNAPPPPPITASPSTYSFSSDSTKLGEIPMRKWTVPWDYAAMERANVEAAAMGRGGLPAVGGMPVVDGGGSTRRRGGLLRFLRRGE
ncbi:hypothetical protein SLS58_011253 [Diplodia intermedia]|uniref:Uncharacterized protein n=1 Tax=Diplodia intermedia TaxID=856260 RepID=A0ABR3T0Z9_9PEZI